MLNINCFRLDTQHMKYSCEFLVGFIDDMKLPDDEHHLLNALLHHRFACETQIRRINQFIDLNFKSDYSDNGKKHE